MAYTGRWQRRERSGWSAVAERAPGATVDTAHSTGDLGEGEAGGARIVSPGPMPADAASLDTGTSSWSSWQSYTGASAGDLTSTTDHSRVDPHDGGIDSGLARISRRPPTAGETYDTDSVGYGTGSLDVTTAALRGKNGQAQNNPQGVRTPVARQFRRHDKPELYGGWLRASLGRISPPRGHTGGDGAAPGSTSRLGPVSGTRQTVKPGFGRTAMLRQPPTSWDEDAVIEATDGAAQAAPADQFWRL